MNKTMNILKILASGDGTLKEPNISALLKFLLDPNAAHKLKFRILKKFIALFDEEFAKLLNNSYSVRLFLEENLTKKNSNRY